MHGTTGSVEVGFSTQHCVLNRVIKVVSKKDVILTLKNFEGDTEPKNSKINNVFRSIDIFIF